MRAVVDLPDRDRAGDADDIGHLAVFGAEKPLRRLEQALRRRDIEREQARQRQIDFDDFFERDRIVERFEPRQIVERQRQRRIGAQRRPFGAGETPIGRERLSPSRRDLGRRSFLALRATPFPRGRTVPCAARVPRARRSARHCALRAARADDRAYRPPRSTSALLSPSIAAMTASTASSPNFLAMRGVPASKRLFV